MKEYKINNFILRTNANIDNYVKTIVISIGNINFNKSFIDSNNFDNSRYITICYDKDSSNIGVFISSSGILLDDISLNNKETKIFIMQLNLMINRILSGKISHYRNKDIVNAWIKYLGINGN